MVAQRRMMNQRDRVRTSFVAIGCVLSCLLPRAVAGERPPDVAGTWEVTTRLPDKALRERWMIQQKGATISGIATGARGDLPVSGSIAGSSFRVTIRDGDKAYRVRAMLDGDAMEGSVTYPVGGEYAWRAHRVRSR
jgi:hypothetical protein